MLQSLFEASLAGETGILGPCVFKRGCLRPVSPARLGFWDLAYIREAQRGVLRR